MQGDTRIRLTLLILCGYLGTVLSFSYSTDDTPEGNDIYIPFVPIDDNFPQESMISEVRVPMEDNPKQRRKLKRRPRFDDNYAKEFVLKNYKEPLPMNEVLNDITALYERLPKSLKVATAPNFGSLMRTLHTIKDGLEEMENNKKLDLKENNNSTITSNDKPSNTFTTTTSPPNTTSKDISTTTFTVGNEMKLENNPRISDSNSISLEDTDSFFPKDHIFDSRKKLESMIGTSITVDTNEDIERRLDEAMEKNFIPSRPVSNGNHMEKGRAIHYSNYPISEEEFLIRKLTPLREPVKPYTFVGDDFQPVTTKKNYESKYDFENYGTKYSNTENSNYEKSNPPLNYNSAHTQFKSSQKSVLPGPILYGSEKQVKADELKSKIERMRSYMGNNNNKIEKLLPNNKISLPDFRNLRWPPKVEQNFPFKERLRPKFINNRIKLPARLRKYHPNFRPSMVAMGSENNPVISSLNDEAENEIFSNEIQSNQDRDNSEQELMFRGTVEDIKQVEPLPEAMSLKQDPIPEFGGFQDLKQKLHEKLNFGSSSNVHYYQDNPILLPPTQFPLKNLREKILQRLKSKNRQLKEEETKKSDDDEEEPTFWLKRKLNESYQTLIGKLSPLASIVSIFGK